MKTFTKLICMLMLIWLNAGTARAQCQAYFYATNDSVAGNLVHVQNNSQGTNLSYTWNFGDGSPLAKGFDPHHQYSVKGTYNICLSITSQTDTACHSTYCMNITTHDSITPPPPPPAGCQAYFYAINDSVTGNLVHVQNNSQGNNLSYTWNFGDGSPLAKSFDPHHQYSVKGTYNICLSITSQTDTSCHSTYCMNITTKDSITPPPPPAGCQAYFYAINDSVTGNLVHFQNHSQGNALSYAWNFGDSSPLSKDFDPNHKYAVKGTYNICLTISSSTDTSCHSTYCMNITTKDSITPPPPPAGCQAYFYAINDSVTGNLVHVQNNSQGNNLSYTWNFGDGSPLAKTFDPHHQYAAHGTYNICLSITSATDTSCHSTYCMNITTKDSVVAPPPAPCHAYFHAMNDTLTGNLVHIQNNSQGNNLSYTWNFGDGSPASNGFDPHHQYTVQGTYNICLTVTSQTDTSCHSTYCDTITTNNHTPVPCNAMFYAVNDSVNSNKVFFYNTSTGNSLKYEWNFGDGKISHDVKPNHEYAVGAYTVCLHVSSLVDTSCHSEFCSVVRIKDPANSCKANFYTYVSGANLNEVHVKYLPAGSGAYTYTINYGDGSSTNSFTHTYAQSGTYTVCLTIANNNGCSDTKCMPVTVGNCKAGFYLYKDSLDSHAYHAVNTSSGHNIQYTWEFGDGATSHDKLPAHVYQNYGKYYVCLSVNDGAGCSDSFCDSIIVTAKTNGQILFDVVAPDGVATAISNVKALSNVALYPNPVVNTAHLNISSVNDDNVKISIVNVLGQVSSLQSYKLVKGNNDVQLNVADLSEGIYYLIITSANNAEQVSLKFVK